MIPPLQFFQFLFTSYYSSLFDSLDTAKATDCIGHKYIESHATCILDKNTNN